MPILMLLAAPIALTNVTPVVGDFGRPVDDAALGAIVGTAGPTTRLSTFVREQGASQSQFTGEDMRAILSNWFADGNVQSITNASLRAG